MVLRAVAVIPEHGVNVAPPPVRLRGVVVAAELELPLVLQNGEPDDARRRPLGEFTLRRRQRFPALLDILIKQRPLRRDGREGVPAGRHVPSMRQVPRRRDEDVLSARILTSLLLRLVRR
jgi:hypothetical protein